MFLDFGIANYPLIVAILWSIFCHCHSSKCFAIHILIFIDPFETIFVFFSSSKHKKKKYIEFAGSSSSTKIYSAENKIMKLGNFGKIGIGW